MWTGNICTPLFIMTSEEYASLSHTAWSDLYDHYCSSALPLLHAALLPWGTCAPVHTSYSSPSHLNKRKTFLSLKFPSIDSKAGTGDGLMAATAPCWTSFPGFFFFFFLCSDTSSEGPGFAALEAPSCSFAPAVAGNFTSDPSPGNSAWRCASVSPRGIPWTSSLQRSSLGTCQRKERQCRDVSNRQPIPAQRRALDSSLCQGCLT